MYKFADNVVGADNVQMLLVPLWSPHEVGHGLLEALHHVAGALGSLGGGEAHIRRGTEDIVC